MDPLVTLTLGPITIFSTLISTRWSENTNLSQFTERWHYRCYCQNPIEGMESTESDAIQQLIAHIEDIHENMGWHTGTEAMDHILCHYLYQWGNGHKCEPPPELATACENIPRYHP